MMEREMRQKMMEKREGMEFELFKRFEKDDEKARKERYKVQTSPIKIRIKIIVQQYLSALLNLKSNSLSLAFWVFTDL